MNSTSVSTGKYFTPSFKFLKISDPFSFIIFFFSLIFLNVFFITVSECFSADSGLSWISSPALLGMGNAGETLRNSPATLWLNPASIWYDSFESSHTTLSLGRSIDIISMTKSFERGHRTGLGYATFGIDGLERRDEAGRYLGNFENRENQGVVAYSITRGSTSLGAALRAGKEKLAEYQASSSMLDLGLIHSFPHLDISLGTRGVLGEKKWAAPLMRKEKIMPFYYTGFAYRFERLLFSATIGHEKEDGFLSKAGLEFALTSELRIRVGTEDGSGTFGLGIKARKFEFDLSYKITEFSDETRFGLIFTEPLTRKKASRQFDRIPHSETKTSKTEADSSGANFSPGKRFLHGSSKEERSSKKDMNQSTGTPDIRDGDKALLEGKYDEAIGIYSLCYEQDPKNRELLKKLGDAHRLAGNRETSLRFHELAEKLK